MNEFVKKIKIKINADTASVKQASADLKKTFEEDLDFKLDGKEIYKNIKNALNEGTDKFTSVIKKLFSDAWKELGNILKYSQLTDTSVREMKLGYGLSDSQAYGYSKALEVTGISSLEDLMYANEQQRSLFEQAFEKYSDRYSDLYDSGFFSTLQEYQVEMNEFKEDLKLQVVEFFVDNKDVIKGGMIALMKLSEITLDILNKIGSLFGSSKSSSLAMSSDSVRNYQSTKSTNISIDNTYNGVGREDRSWLANAGSMTYAQIINALKGGN